MHEHLKTRGEKYGKKGEKRVWKERLDSWNDLDEECQVDRSENG